jgi:uncharacterized protein YcaQ
VSITELTNDTARRLFLQRHALLEPPAGPAKGAALADLVERLGFVQVDSVNTLARAHDLILWSRRGRYRPRALENAVARRRTAFEHWTHDAAVIPTAFYPMWRLKFAREEARMRARWPQWRRDGWSAELDAVLRHVEACGPACSRDVGEGEARGSSGWWDWHPSKTALEFLWRSGRLAVCHRAGFRKYYDLAERVIPAEYLNARLDDAEIVDWAMQAASGAARLRHERRTGRLLRYRDQGRGEGVVREALAAGRVIEAEIETAAGARRRSFTTEAMLDRAASLPEPAARVRRSRPSTRRCATARGRSGCSASITASRSSRPRRSGATAITSSR